MENLAVRCCNCHSQTDTHGSKNKAYHKDGFKDKLQMVKIEEKKINKCPKCNIEIDRKSKLCLKCSSLNQRTVKRPEYEILKMEVNDMGYVKTGKKYGVSDNAIRKWEKNYEKNYKIIKTT